MSVAVPAAAAADPAEAPQVQEHRATPEVLDATAAAVAEGDSSPVHYDASAITVLEGLDAVRKRPGMYIGSTGERGLHHLVQEVVDNSVDEALAGYCDTIDITLLADGGVRVRDNGRGIPVDIVESEGKPAVTVVMTVLHAGGKFGGGGYAVSGGLHGVGISVVNALSSVLDVVVKREGRVWRQTFHVGVPTADLEPGEPTDETGTEVTFWASEDVFETTDYSFETLASRFREMAFLNKGLTLTLRDERPEHVATAEDGSEASVREVTYRYEGGLVDFVKHLNSTKGEAHRSIIAFELEDTEKHMALEVAMQWNTGFAESVYTFANTINTHEGGTHEEGFRSSLTGLVNDFAERQNLIKKKEDRLTGDDVREGLTAIISIKLGEPQFEGPDQDQARQHRGEVLRAEGLQRAARRVVRQEPCEGKEIIRKVDRGRLARVAARKARELARSRKGPAESGGLPGKLADCQWTDPEKCEVYIVEGDSAGGSAKGGRDSTSRRSCRSAARSSTSRRPASTGCLQNTEVQALISRSAPASTRTSTSRSCATTRSS
jgi:DNA gyrase subunit B